MARLRRKKSKAVFQGGASFTGTVYRGKLPRASYSGGGIMGNIFKKMLPSQMMKTVAKTVATKVPRAALKTGAKFMKDVMSGRNVKHSLRSSGKNLGSQALKIAKEAVVQSLTGQTKKRKKKRPVTAVTAAARKQTKKTKKVGRPKKQQRGGGGMKTVPARKYTKKNQVRNVFGE